VPGAGLEPARPNEHMPLKHACLPISAPGLIRTAKIDSFLNFPMNGYDLFLMYPFAAINT